MKSNEYKIGALALSLILVAMLFASCRGGGYDEVLTSGGETPVSIMKIVPANATVPYGGNLQFKMTLSGDALGVVWEVSNAISTDTEISSSGLLSVASDETAKIIIIKASLSGKTLTTTVNLCKPLVFQNDDIADNSTLTITVTSDKFAIAGSANDEKNLAGFSLADNIIILQQITGNRRLAISGGHATIPLKVQADNVDIQVETYNPVISLANNANVNLIVKGENKVETTGIYNSSSYSAIWVPLATKIDIRGYTDDFDENTLFANGAANNTYKGGSFRGAGIGGYGDTTDTGAISIGDGISVTAKGATGCAAIGGVPSGSCGTITIYGNAHINALSTSGGGAAAIGSGNYGQKGGYILIKDDAVVYAETTSDGPGIGMGYVGGSGGATSIDIKIEGNALVYAKGGSDGAAAIGTGFVNNESTILAGVSITIGDGTDNPIVIAKAGSNGSYDRYPVAIGYAGKPRAGGSVNITINSGFVIADHDESVPGIGAPADMSVLTASIKFLGGSIYANGGAVEPVNPAPKNAAGLNVYPLYAESLHSGGMLINVPLSEGITYNAISLSNFAADFITALSSESLFPQAEISAVLWVPVGTYSGINAGSANNLSAEVLPNYTSFSQDLSANRF